MQLAVLKYVYRLSGTLHPIASKFGRLPQTHSPPTPIPATEVGSFFASIWPDTVVVAHYFEQIFVYFQKKIAFLEGK